MHLHRSYTFEEVVAVPCTLLPIATICVITRCVTKTYMLRKFTLDDWFLVASYVIFAALELVSIQSARAGFGAHMSELTAGEIKLIFEYWYIQQILYLLTNVLLKLSIAILLLSFPMQRFLRIIVLITAIFHTLTGIGFLGVGCFICSPAAAFWDSSIQGKCVDEHIIGIAVYIAAATTLVTDAILTAIPIKMIWSMQLQTSARISASVIFGLASLASVANIVRLAYVYQLVIADDSTYGYFSISSVSQLEVGLATIAASLITCRPVLRWFLDQCRKQKHLNGMINAGVNTTSKLMKSRKGSGGSGGSGVSRTMDTVGREERKGSVQENAGMGNEVSLARKRPFPSPEDVADWGEECRMIAGQGNAAVATDMVWSGEYGDELDLERQAGGEKSGG